MKLEYSGSPHIKNKRTTKGIMLDVCIALLPALVASIVFFGVNSLFICLISVVACVLSEGVYKLALKKDVKTIVKEFDFTSLVTGLLLGLNMPPIQAAKYWYIPLLSGIFAIIVVKMLFGGTGCNIANPAIAGRVFALMSFTVVMTQSYALPDIEALGNAVTGASVTTGATPLTEFLATGGADALQKLGITTTDLFLGTGIAGTIGETCKLALVIGGIYLCVRGVINPLFPLIYIAVTGLFAVMLNGFDFTAFLPSILSGGLILGAIFMATDYVTTPTSFLGNVIYFALLGLLTAGLRAACKMEVVSFAILLCNLLVPLIDKFVYPKPFGYVKKKNGGEKK